MIAERKDPQKRNAAALRAELAKHFAARDGAGAVKAALEAVEKRAIDVRTLYRDVLTPLLVDTGAGWQSGDLRVWEEHHASAAVRTIVEALHPPVQEAKPKPSGKKVLLACPPEEAHDLGLRMLADLLELAGWQTYFLGAGTPTDEIVDAVKKLAVDTVALSVSTHYNRLRLHPVVGDLRRQLPGVRIYVGGAAFAHDRGDWSEEEAPDLDVLLAEAGAPPGQQAGGD